MLKGNRYFVSLLLFLHSFSWSYALVSENDNNQWKEKALELNYPTPPGNEHSLFYVQRSKNTNAIVYESNLLPDGTLNPNDPVRIYWISYSTDSSISDLSYIQKHYAYGLDFKAVEGKEGNFILNFVSYDKKKFYLVPKKEGKSFQALTMINGKMAILERVFIKIEGGSFWFPEISDIEMRGHDPQTKEEVVEHFKP
ncbi:MAG: DUF4833 domain-containing protein [Bacteroidia bacterium]|nr:DUF4833 domain-containing protein [Bacteroidia bacterium]